MYEGIHLPLSYPFILFSSHEIFFLKKNDHVGIHDAPILFEIKRLPYFFKKSGGESHANF